MREIKFRAWSISTQTMYALDPYGDKARDSNLFDLAEHETWKVMQYTGLKDKNGKEIYEGDIIRRSSASEDAPKYLVHKWENVEAVIWRGDYAMWGTPTSMYGLGLYKHIEVIGNIYENEDLLNN